MYEPIDPGFATINKISAAQRAFFDQMVQQMQKRPYEKWTTLWAEPPNPTLVRTPFGDSGDCSDAWEACSICFYSRLGSGPGHAPAWQMHAKSHAKCVTTRSEWRARLVKGVVSDFLLAGQVCACSECRREHEQLVKRLHHEFFEMLLIADCRLPIDDCRLPIAA